jgi:hexokinase
MDTQEPLPAASPAENALAALTSFINPTCLLDLARRFSDTYTALAQTSTQHFLVTPVTALPTGKEKGKFMSIDVGGTNLRVGLIELLGEEEEVGTSDGVDSTAKKIKRRCDRNWPIEEHLKVDKAEDLFAWIGDCIAEVVTDAMGEVGGNEDVEGMFGEELLLGITFSFPMA